MPDKFQNKYRIASARLQWWDYGKNAAYFVTICTQKREHFFGNISNNEMHLTDIGQLAHKFWAEIPHHFTFVHLGEFVIMPNHVHGIIIIP
jgi:REP element-mobilizing transposase RayT